MIYLGIKLLNSIRFPEWFWKKYDLETGKNKIQCSHCGKVFKRRKVLARHVKQLVCFKDFVCEFRNKTLKIQSSLYFHKSQSCKMIPEKRLASTNNNEDSMMITNYKIKQ